MRKCILAAGLGATLIAALALGASANAATRKSTDAKEPTVGQMAARERLKKCAAEWKEMKQAGKVEAGMKWPKYWSACNKRLKEQKA